MPTVRVNRVNRPVKLNTYLYKDVIIDHNVTGLPPSGIEAADPSIVWDPINNRWLIYFYAYVNNIPEIYVAESNDLLSVRFLGKALPVGDPGSWDSGTVAKPYVMYLDGTYYMFYAGSSIGKAIGLATSTDGINFTKYTGNPILTDPEGTNYLDAPTIIKWKDGSFYMWAYNGNGKNIVFRTTSDKFPFGWVKVGTLESRFFGIYSTEAFYDDEIDKVILLANIFYPKPSGVSEPERTGALALYVGDHPLRLTYYGCILAPILADTTSTPVKYLQRNIYAPGIAKIGYGKYVVLFNAYDGTNEKILRMDIGVDSEQTLHIKNVYTTSQYSTHIPLLRIPPGTRVILKHAVVYAFSGTPSEIYLYDLDEYINVDNVLAWTNTNLLEFNGDITVNSGVLGIIINGRPPIEIAYNVKVTIKPSIDTIS
jgi:hypothetical protein